MGEPTADGTADPAPLPPGLVAGVDGCPAGWIAVWLDPAGNAAPRRRVHARFAEILAAAPALVAVDMPIGLPDRVGAGGRGPESLVRPLLGERQSSVFSVPSRAAVWAAADLADPLAYRVTCRAALETSDPPRQISKQCFHILGKIREIDALLTAGAAAPVHETHPELAFWRLAGERAMSLPKKVKNRPNPAGIAERVDLLVGHGLDRAFLEAARPRGVGADDLVDAAACALMALRLMQGTARPFPDPPARDRHGLAIAIWA